jgi:hypothetical protein
LPARQRPLDIGTARGRAIVAELCREAEAARLEHGLSYATIGRSLGLDRSQASRLCRGVSSGVSIVRAAQLLAVVGLELGARAYPGAGPVRDAAEIGLLRRFRAVVSPRFRWRGEVPVIEMPGSTDRRAWDGALEGAGLAIRVEAETAIRDTQALLRRLALKRRDGRAECLVLVVSDTSRNRAAVAAAAVDFSAAFPATPRAALRDLRAGRAPAADALLYL